MPNSGLDLDQAGNPASLAWVDSPVGPGHMYRLAVYSLEPGTQRFMPRDDVIDGLFQRIDVEIALQSQSLAKIVRRIVRFELGQEPESLLRK